MIFKSMKAALCISLLFVNIAIASPVFKIEKGDKVLYLGGTMHLLNKTDYPLPKAFKQAYEASQTLVFETDLAAMSKPEVQQQSLALLTYTDGRSLNDALSETTLLALQKYLESRNVPYNSFKVMKPGLAAIMLSVIELSHLGFNHPGVDSYYNTLAIGDGKTIEWLETPMEQFSFLAKIGENNSDEYLQYTLNDLGNISDSARLLKQAWRSGDLAALAENGIASWAKEYPDIYSIILTERNAKWMIKIHKFLNSDKTELVLVGALHLAGEHGLIKQLKQAGYAVTRL